MPCPLLGSSTFSDVDVLQVSVRKASRTKSQMNFVVSLCGVTRCSVYQQTGEWLGDFNKWEQFSEPQKWQDRNFSLTPSLLWWHVTLETTTWGQIHYNLKYYLSFLPHHQVNILMCQVSNTLRLSPNIFSSHDVSINLSCALPLLLNSWQTS